jgi:hypothetical protein
VGKPRPKKGVGENLTELALGVDETSSGKRGLATTSGLCLTISLAELMIVSPSRPRLGGLLLLLVAGSTVIPSDIPCHRQPARQPRPSPARWNSTTTRSIDPGPCPRQPADSLCRFLPKGGRIHTGIFRKRRLNSGLILPAPVFIFLPAQYNTAAAYY